MISAHRMGANEIGASENSFEALYDVLNADVDYIEFDVRRTRDGELVVRHDQLVHSVGGSLPVEALSLTELADFDDAIVHYVDVLEIISKHNSRGDRSDVGAHVDLKVEASEVAQKEPSWAIDATRDVISALGSEHAIITLPVAEAVNEVREWVQAQEVAIPVGLSVSGDCAVEQRALTLCGATLVAAEQSLAPKLRTFCRDRDIPLLVWTVDEPQELEKWLASDATWMVTTNTPRAALEISNHLLVE